MEIKRKKERKKERKEIRVDCTISHFSYKHEVAYFIPLKYIGLALSALNFRTIIQ
jgi:hypothetical protein